MGSSIMKRISTGFYEFKRLLILFRSFEFVEVRKQEIIDTIIFFPDLRTFIGAIK